MKKKIILCTAITFYCVIYTCPKAKKEIKPRNLAPYTFNVSLEYSGEGVTKQSSLTLGNGKITETITFSNPPEGSTWSGSFSQKLMMDNQTSNNTDKNIVLLKSLRAIQAKGQSRRWFHGSSTHNQKTATYCQELIDLPHNKH